MKQKKIPLRKCLGCGCQKPKQELVRVVRSAEGESRLTSPAKRRAGERIYAKAHSASKRRAKQSG